VIEETITLTRGQMVRNDVSLSLALDARIPHVFGDRIQLQQVILNLIVNAIEAMASITGRERRLEIRSQFEPHSGIRVSVQDAGVGIAEELIPRLFDPFFTTRTQGIGMGLAISHSIVEAHRGRLWAESKVNQGTLFQLTLPMQEGFTHETC
jgi:signal transduction histidine kinase